MSEKEEGPGHEHLAAAVLLGVGLAAFVLVWLGYREATLRFATPPAASGEIGILRVYAQLPERGPVPLTPSTPYRLPRPQDFAFQLTAKGTGPRIVRIENEAVDARDVLYEERLEAPLEDWSLAYVLSPGDTAPSTLKLVITVESPHAGSLRSEYFIQLYGSPDPEDPVKPGPPTDGGRD